MTQLMTTVLGLVLLLGSSTVAVYPQASQRKPAKRDVPIEEFSFLIKDFRIDHQTETNTLNISISFRYVPNIANSDYPDFRWLAKDVETLLTNYPNENDYWEIVNKQITSLLMKKYPSLTRITCELKVDPSRLVPYTRSSRVTRDRPVVKSNPRRV